MGKLVSLSPDSGCKYANGSLRYSHVFPKKAASSRLFLPQALTKYLANKGLLRKDAPICSLFIHRLSLSSSERPRDWWNKSQFETLVIYFQLRRDTFQISLFFSTGFLEHPTDYGKLKLTFRSQAYPCIEC